MQFYFLFLILCYVKSSIANNIGINIVGGIKVPISNTDFRFMTSLQRKNSNSYYHFCGGSLVDPWWIITAAHCVKYSKPDRVRIGSYNTDDGGVIRTVSEVIMHPKYFIVDRHDIAFLKLNEPVNDIPTLPIDLDGKYDKANELVTSIGWGYTKENAGYTVKDLRMVELIVLSNKICNEQYKGEINDGNICTWGKWNPKTKQRQDQCSGDSGGPSFYYNNGILSLVGLTSWGYGCGRKEYAGVNTRVSYYADFIREVLNMDSMPTASPTSRPTSNLRGCYINCRRRYKNKSKRWRCRRLCRKNN